MAQTILHHPSLCPSPRGSPSPEPVLQDMQIQEDQKKEEEPGSPSIFIYKVGVQLSHQGRILEVLPGFKETCRSCGEPAEWTSTVWRFWRSRVFGEVLVESWSNAAVFQSGLWASLSRGTDRKEFDKKNFSSEPEKVTHRTSASDCEVRPSLLLLLLLLTECVAVVTLRGGESSSLESLIRIIIIIIILYGLPM